MRKNRFWPVIFILIGWGLRLTLLGEQSLWYDEGVTWMLSQMQLPDLINWTADDIQPPLYYLLIWTTDVIIDDSEWALRFPSVVFGILTIPLSYTLARHLFAASPQRSFTALLATAIFTLSPLMVYYSQEARMYTLLTFEAALASYLLLKILHSNNITYFYSVFYALTATAALYTHYFAAFLLIAHALYALYILWQQHFSKRLLGQLLISFGGALLLFAPWLPTLLARLGDDPSYWPGVLKLNEVFRNLLISFTVGETVLEQTGWWLSLGFLVIFIYSSWTILSKQTRNSASIPNSKFKIHNSQFFLLLWLLLPILLILALTTQSPKFNPRYSLLVWPAFALFLAKALAGLRHPNNPKPETRNPKRLSNVLFFISIIFILTATAFSLVNWFTDPRFSKDDFKALAQFVRERKASDETVLLSSGHLFPVWAYYYGWEDWTPLPWMLRLDVNQVTNLEIASDIAAAVEDKGGVWLVTWQDEVIDPNGVVPFWLDLIGQRPNDAGDFWGVGLEHWRLDRDKIGLLEENPIHRPVGFQMSTKEESAVSLAENTTLSVYNFANQIDLLGYTQLSDTNLVFFWRARQPLPDDIILTLNLTDKDGFGWSRKIEVARLGAPSYPPSRWSVGEIVMTHHQLQWQIGTPPGLYVAEVGLGTTGGGIQTNGSFIPNNDEDFVAWDILDEQGKPQRRTALLDFVNLSQLVEPASGPLPIDKDPIIDLLPIIGLRRSILPQETAQPGDRLLLALLWQAGEYNLDDVSIVFDLVDAAGQPHRVGSSFTPSRNFNLPRWEIGDTVLGQYWLDIPPEAAPGPAILQVHIINVTAYPYDEVFPFDEIEILPTERNFTLPASIDIPLKAHFSGQATLIGLDCPANCTVSPDESITLTLYWQADGPFDVNYTIFTHLLDSKDTVLINADHAPPKPTQGWVTGEIIADPVILTIPANLPPGNYPIEIGLYDSADSDFQRLPLINGETRLISPQPLMVK